MGGMKLSEQTPQRCAAADSRSDSTRSFRRNWQSTQRSFAHSFRRLGFLRLDFRLSSPSCHPVNFGSPRLRDRLPKIPSTGSGRTESEAGYLRTPRRTCRGTDALRGNTRAGVAAPRGSGVSSSRAVHRVCSHRAGAHPCGRVQRVWRHESALEPPRASVRIATLPA